MFEPPSEEERNAAPPPPNEADEWEPVESVPAGAPEPPAAHPRLGRPSGRWAYRTADGGLSGVAVSNRQT